MVADSLLHRLNDQQLRLSQQLSMDEWASWGDALFRLAEPSAVVEVLGQRYHSVVGNPPYIVEQDPAKKRRFKELYESITGRWALAAPFTERFFDLGVEGAFVGMINSNSWTKRDYGKALIERVLPQVDVQKIIDTSGCYLPGHGTPTLLLFGRNRPSPMAPIPAVLGKRGEQTVPSDPSRAPVWNEIVENHGTLGFDGPHVSVEVLSWNEAKSHPWVMAGGGSRQLLRHLEVQALSRLHAFAAEIGFDTITRASQLIEQPATILRRAGVEEHAVMPYVNGNDVRDWSIEHATTSVTIPYERVTWTLLPLSGLQGLGRFLWPHREWLSIRWVSGGTTMRDVGMAHWAIPQFPARKHAAAFRITLSYVSTHNHFYLDRGGRTFNRSAPIVNLKSHHTEADHQVLLGYLNSSTVGFWCRLVMFPKGGDQVGDGARLSATQWNRHLDYASNLLQQLPVPDFGLLGERLLDLVVAAEETVQAMAEYGAEKVVATVLTENPSLTALREARTSSLAERARLRGILVSLQEEMDWRIYGIFGVPTLTASSLDAVRVPVEPNQRPFEVRLAREIATDFSASEWFRMHKRPGLTEVAGPLADLYRQRLRLLEDPDRGRQLRLLETPETKRRWSPADEARAFGEAVRTWLLDRIESLFRAQRTPELRTVRQLALDLGRDAAVQAAYELLTEDSGCDLVKLVSDLVDAEGVPFLAGFRYTEVGMEKRAAWEETWRLQRLEDAGALEPELRRLGLKAIPLPDKYANKDFLRHYWSLRGKLDVTKERFVTVPSGNNEDDPTPLCGWAGWDNLQTAQALASLYQRRKTEDGWTGDRLVPLLAGLAERVPWLLQWHNEPTEEFGGVKLGDFFRDFVAGEAHGLEIAVDFTKATDDLRAWTPPATAKRQTIDPDELYAALLRWVPEADEDADEDEDSEPPEGPTLDELASEVGANKALVNKGLRALIADGRVEKLDGRPARYLATGDDA